MFKPIEENEKVYKKIMKQIQNLILNNTLKPGDKLPPERQLAETFKVGRPAVKQALSALEALNIVQCRHGDGNYITMESPEVFNPLAIKFCLNNGDENDIVEFRYILEVQMASLAAVKITDAQIDDFENLIDEMKNANTPEERAYYNKLFHTRIVEICGNKLIESIYEGITDLINMQVQVLDGENFYQSHLCIFDAIKNRDPVTASLCMSNHFENKFPNYKYYEMLKSNQ